MIPQSVKSFLWSSDKICIDPKKHKKAIISQVLNFGDRKSSNWIFRYYGKKEVREVAREIPLGQWDRKSLALWSLILGIKPKARRTK